MEEIAKGLYCLGDLQFPTFLIKGRESVVLVDAGPAFMAPYYFTDIKKLLGEAKAPDLLLFTHFHYDHVGGTPYLSRHFPEMRLGGSKQLARFLALETAIVNIAALNRELVGQHAKAEDITSQDLDFRDVKVDMIVKDGDIVDLGGGVEIEVIATPGHTRDSLSYRLPHAGAVLTGDAIGMIMGEALRSSPEFISSYEDYLRSIQRVREKAPQFIVFGHHRWARGDEAESYLDHALSDCRDHRGRIEAYLGELEMDQEKVVQRIKNEEHLACRQGGQPEKTYLMNLRAQVRLIAKGMRKRGF